MKPLQNLRVQFSLDPRLNLVWQVLARLLLDVDDVLGALLDDRFVGDG